MASSVVTPATALDAVPASLRDPLLAALSEIATNFAAHKWGPSEVDAGKLCECAYWILRSHADGKWVSKPSKPSNMVDACAALAKAPKTLPHSVRITTPRVIVALYELRNNRGASHVGGDVDPNHMDATLVLAGAKWIVAELVRIFHNVTTAEATAVVDALVERVVPAVWAVGTTRRVLVTGLTLRDQTLLLLYGPAGWVSEASLVADVEHPEASKYRRDVLVPAHKVRLIEYDAAGRRALITPKGVEYVETKLGHHLKA